MFYRVLWLVIMTLFMLVSISKLQDTSIYDMKRTLYEKNFVEDFKMLPSPTIYGVADPDEKLDILNSLITECIERHAPLRRTKITSQDRLKDPTILDLQKQRSILQANARRSKATQAWEQFCSACNCLKAFN